MLKWVSMKQVAESLNDCRMEVIYLASLFDNPRSFVGVPAYVTSEC